jgi:hypothetical protein
MMTDARTLGFRLLSIPVDEQELESLDQAGYVVLDAILHDHAPPGGSLATPHAFVCMDGSTYWVKAQAQQGLAAELIAGRLAKRVNAGPDARIIRVPPEALPTDGTASHLEGLNVGTRDCPGTVNVKELGTIGVTSVDKKHVDASARARVVAFQSWIQVGDTQCLIDMTNGGFHSIDHGEVFSAVDNMTDPTLCICEPPGLPRLHGAEKKACGGRMRPDRVRLR